MKNIPEPPQDIAATLTPAEMNKIHFGGIHSPLTPEQIKALAEGQPTEPSPPSHHKTPI